MNWLFEFPFKIPINTDSIDSAVRGFAADHNAFFYSIKMGLTQFVNVINWVLTHIPWPLLIIAVFVLGWRSRKRIRSGMLYAVLLFCIGALGLWDLMLLTLAIVLGSAIIALFLGLLIGILISGSRRANAILRPILDTMQTLPVYVYLIPAVIFFGMGTASAVICSVVYAIVPVIRLTSLGIRQVDVEVVEAARAFGSTRVQMLFKVQIPQAMPTIMAGVNQTTMMAMSMVVTCSLIGARGLGNEVITAVNRTEISRGLIAGLCVVIIAILLDRLTQGWFAKTGGPTDEERKGLQIWKK